MKSILAWVKSNLVIVILVVVTLLALPALLYLSERMNAKLKADVQKQVDDDSRAIQQVSVTYRVPSIDPAVKPVEVVRPPNAATTDAVRQEIEKLKGQSDAIVKLAIDRNKDGHKPMLDGLFPQPAQSDDVRLRQLAGDVWVKAHEDLLRRTGGGTPPDAEFVATRLLTEKSRLEQLGEATEETLAQNRAQLTDMRMSLYRGRASELQYYALPGVFVGVQPWKSATLPTIATIWDWQHRLWVNEDLLRAVVRANTDPSSGAPLPIPAAPVKRVESILVPAWTYDGVEPPSAGGGPDIGAPVPSNFEASVTGRAAWPFAPNAMYGIRYAEVSMIVASEALPRVIESFPATDYMTVLDLRLEAVDPQAALAEGFYYGPQHVVRARFTVETLWLRAWMKDLMPQQVKDAEGLGAPPAKGHSQEEQ